MRSFSSPDDDEAPATYPYRGDVIATALVTEAVFLLDELKKTTVADLRNACVERGVTQSGNKSDLISNITSHQDELVHSKKRKTDGGTETPSKKPQNSGDTIGRESISSLLNIRCAGLFG